MMKHDTAEAGAGLTQVAPAPHPAGRVASAQALRVRRPASETAEGSFFDTAGYLAWRLYCADSP